MTSETQPESLTSRALARLRALVDGNGLAPETLELVESDEKTYLLTGSLHLDPQMATTAQMYQGVSRAKNAKPHASIAALRAAVQSKIETYQKSEDWIEEALKEAETAPGQGWGLTDFIIALPSEQQIWTATDPCPACEGKKQTLCPQCSGQQRNMCLYCKGTTREPCPLCFGSGQDPTHADKPCPTCQGRRETPCRYCQALGWTPCLNCQGRGWMPCHDCRGSGQITEDITLSGRATPTFHLDRNTDLPSPMLRAFNRLGIGNLGKGHARIAMRHASKEEQDDNIKNKATLFYKAELPLAQIKLRFGSKERVVQIASFGLKGILLDCPPFLDTLLKPARKALFEAMIGKAPMESATSARAIKDALALHLSGKALNTDNGTKELRRLYPIGLSPTVAHEIVLHTGRALAHTTRIMRGVVATLLFALFSALNVALFYAPAFTGVLHILPPKYLLTLLLLTPVIESGLAWLLLKQAARAILKRRFKNMPIHLHQNTGHIGIGLIVALCLGQAALLFLTK